MILSKLFTNLNKANQEDILKEWKCSNFIELQSKVDELNDEELDKLESDLIKQFCLMDKNRAYILCKVIDKEGNEEFERIREAQVKDSKQLLKGSGIDEINWFSLKNNEEHLRKFAFYKLKKRTWRDEEGNEKSEEKILVFQTEFACYGGIIWVILKFPLIGLENNKPYKFEQERNDVFFWATNYLNTPIQLLLLKEFYENFQDQPPLEKTGWNARSYKDDNNEITEGDFGIKLDYKEGIELNKVYKSIDENIGPSFNEKLELCFIDYCTKNNIDYPENIINFFRESQNLLDSETIFKGIQARCEYLVGSIGLFENLVTGAKREKIRYNIEKIRDETAGLLRMTHQGDEYFNIIFHEIKKYFDKTATS